MSKTKSLPVLPRTAGPEVIVSSVGGIRMYLASCGCGAQIETGSSLAAVDFTLEHAHLKDVA